MDRCDRLGCVATLINAHDHDQAEAQSSGNCHADADESEAVAHENGQRQDAGVDVCGRMAAAHSDESTSHTASDDISNQSLLVLEQDAVDTRLGDADEG